MRDTPTIIVFESYCLQSSFKASPLSTQVTSWFYTELQIEDWFDAHTAASVTKTQH